MSDPTSLPEEERAKVTLQAQTEEIDRLERLLSQQGQGVQSIAEIEEPAALPEKLFSRRTLFGWAFATLLIIFVVRMVLPVLFDTVKKSVVTRMKEQVGNTAVTPVVAPTPPTSVIPAPPVPAKPAEPAATTGPTKKADPTVVKIEIKKR